MDAKTNAGMTLTFPSDREIAMTRVFDAPRRLVFEVWTKPEHIKHWYGCDAVTLVTCAVDLRLGGGYRFVLRGPEGGDFTMSGVYREVTPPERLVYTERFNDDPEKEALVTLTLTEQNGRTTLHSTALYRSADDRDAVLRMGVEQGAAQTMQRLADHLATLQ